MALQRFVIDGYGQLELNQVAFRRDGRIEAQCELNPADFANVPAENGMLLAVDNAHNIVKFPVAGEVYPIALNYTSEHMYDERANALKDFKLERDSFYPRLGYLAVGDKFTTNCLGYDTTDFANDEALVSAYENGTVIYGGIATGAGIKGAIKVSKTKPSEGPVLLAVKGTGAGTMPDGSFGMKFQVVAV